MGIPLPVVQTIRSDVDVFSLNNQLDPAQSDNDTSRVATIVGLSLNLHGVHGANGQGTGATPKFGTGVWGESDNGFGVYGGSLTADAVFGTGANGVHGQSSNPDGNGVWGENSGSGPGVNGFSKDGSGVIGAGGFAGVVGQSEGTAVLGLSNAGTAVYGSSQNGTAGQFDGSVLVNGQVRISGDLNMPGGNIRLTRGDVLLSGRDCAEDFEIAEAETVEPGTVMVVNSEGAMEQSHKAYDKRVAGIISGAGPFRPAIILGRESPQENRMPIALVGRAYCKVDAQYAPINAGDLLTTSPTPGHAMKAGDPIQSFGCVLGKALHSLEVGQGMIPVLVTLQ